MRVRGNYKGYGDIPLNKSKDDCYNKTMEPPTEGAQTNKYIINTIMETPPNERSLSDNTRCGDESKDGR